ncbi:MAG: hypothetical protein Q4E55_09540 [Bacteroidales bacterium]|nr:hypothetical protein [Bacteroidales bacterium]
MTYKFRIISDEVDNYLREIKIDAEATFLNFHKAILKSNSYKDDQMTSFFICDDDWEKQCEITLEDMGDGASDIDTYVMGDTKLNELLDDEKQKLIYVFDPLTDRCLFMELSEIITGKALKNAQVSRSEGTPPPQNVDFEEILKKHTDNVLDLDESFYGDEGFDEEEFDPEGFELTDGPL